MNLSRYGARPARRVAGGLAAALCGVLAAGAHAGDWTQWGGTNDRNMVSPGTGAPTRFEPGTPREGSEEIDPATTRGVRWVAKLGSQSYGNPTVANGRVFVGTNNESPRDPKYKGDRSCLYAFDEKTGKFLWQLNIPKLGTGKVSDWEYLGLCSSPTVVGNRLYIVTNRCEVMCLDVEGLANGNDGPFKDEAQYTAGPGAKPIEQGPQDADIIWRYDLRDELGVFPHNTTSNSPLILGDRLYVATSNGVDWTHTNIPAPKAPAFICLDRNTGELLGEETSGVSKRMYHCNWASPSAGKVGDRELVFFAGGDGWTYAFDAQPVPGEDGINTLKEVWRFDCNPAEYKTRNFVPIRYPAKEGPSEIIATPVFYKNRIYVAVGQDPEHGEGLGAISCIDATKTGDITKTGQIWRDTTIARSMSTVSIANDLVFVADYSGYVHCYDAENGKKYWTHKTGSHIWGSTLAVDGKVYIGNEDGDLLVFAAAKEFKELGKINVGAPIYSSPVFANGMLYVATQTQLYAIGGEARSASAGEAKP